MSAHALRTRHPEEVGAAARALQVVAGRVDELVQALERHADGLVRGAAARAALERAEQLRADLQAAVTGLEVLARALTVTAESLHLAKVLLARADGLAAGAGLVVLDDGSVPVLRLPAMPGVLAAAEAAQAHAREALLAAGEADRAGAAAVRSVPALPGGLLGALLGAVVLAPVGHRPPPAAGAPAGRVIAWWSSLTPAARRAVLGHRQEQVAGLDGLPAGVRDRVNRELLERWLAVPPPSGSFDRVRDWAVRVQVLLSVEQALAATPGAQLLLLDPTGSGRAVVAVGDVDTAAHVAVLVPGLNARVRRSLGGYVHEAARLRERALHVAAAGSLSAGSVAAVAWLGYRAPGLRTVPFEGRARRGAVALREALRGLDARATSAGRDLHLVLSGHSYGSLVAGHATRERTGVDDLVLLGSPGAGVLSARQLWVPPQHVFVAEASLDVVGDLGRFGSDPSSRVFGARQLQTDGRDEPGAEPLRGIHGHTSYYDRGSQSLDNLAQITLGRPDRASYDR